jgi:hypothetical protein
MFLLLFLFILFFSFSISPFLYLTLSVFLLSYFSRSFFVSLFHSFFLSVFLNFSPLFLSLPISLFLPKCSCIASDFRFSWPWLWRPLFYLLQCYAVWFSKRCRRLLTFRRNELLPHSVSKSMQRKQ